jgi:hypothetical protein
MTTFRLAIDLQEGFDGEEVVVLVDGGEVLRRAVRTHPITGFAEHVSVDLAPGRHEIEVVRRGAAPIRHEVDVAGDVHVGMDGGSGEIVTSDRPFGYG